MTIGTQKGGGRRIPEMWLQEGGRPPKSAGTATLPTTRPNAQPTPLAEGLFAAASFAHPPEAFPLGLSRGAEAQSLFVIVATAWPSAIVALLAPVSFTLKTSLPSTSKSPLMLTVMVLLFCPGVKVSVPLLAT